MEQCENCQENTYSEENVLVEEKNDMQESAESELRSAQFDCGNCNDQRPDFPPGQEIINVFEAVIEEVNNSRNDTFVTITYRNCPICREPERTVTLVVGQDTVIRNERGGMIRPAELKEGMVINASFSATMTRSIPPQAQAFLIMIVKRPTFNQTTVGRIAEINMRNHFILLVGSNNPSSVIRFNLSPETEILDPMGRRIPLNRLRTGIRVRVEHASFMTASIPPQATAFKIQVIR